MTINAQMSEEERQAVQIRFNGIPLSRGVFDGKFFVNRQITLEATTAEGTQIAGWEVKQITNSGTNTATYPSGNTYSFTMPSCNRLMINTIFGDPSGIIQVDKHNWRWQMDQQQLILTDVPAGTTVTLYNLQGMQLAQVKADGSTIQLPLREGQQVYILKVGNETKKITSASHSSR